MSKMKLKDEICHLFVEQDNSEKLIVEVYFDISDFKIEQEIYDFFGEMIYGNGREHLNSIIRGTKGFGGGLSSFEDYFTSYLIDITCLNRNELLSITITNKQKKEVSEFWITFISIIMHNFFASHRDVCHYAECFEVSIAKDILNKTMKHFSFLLADNLHRPANQLDEDGKYL